jgi:pyruvate formate lyase activating enzyme
MKVPARYWAVEGEKVRCRLCPNRCLVSDGKAGRCLGRENVGGELFATNYGEVVSAAMDPVEKKPLYHFRPGTEVLSVATYGCNLLCPFCQNCEISQQRAPSRYLAPADLVRLAREHRSSAVAFTYTEPLIWFEYLMDSCPLLHGAGIGTILVTNGMIEPEPLAELLPHVDAMNVDLKSVRPEFYRDYIKGSLDAVMNTIRVAAGRIHLEITNLLIPGRNDSEAELSELVDFIAGLSPTIPLHLSRYFPRHRASEPATPVATLLRAAEVARARLDYVYLGNILPAPEYRDTFCPQCHNRQVEREGYRGRVVGIEGGRCGRCGRPVDLVL